jgi:predicted NAD/FAD-binding protein
MSRNRDQAADRLARIDRQLMGTKATAATISQSWGGVSGVRRTLYCGADWFSGLHEDGLNSAVRVGRVLGGAW